ncbi:hypothetical protein MPS_4652 [Mycobacterium pseudoshottsii JCM 15466]|nr:hypothetical protein MPS_4652 [Mycobacterium pseudoshottsii JCM 15466]
MDAHPQLRTRAGPADELIDGALWFGRSTVECIQQELIVGHFRRHPIELRIDGRHRVRRHRFSPAGQ